MDTPVTNLDMLAWFREDERHECPACGDRACVTLPDALATFCLACGRISIGGVSIELRPEPEVVAHGAASPVAPIQLPTRTNHPGGC